MISSQSRYDHFDTSPYMLTRIREINALFNFIRIFIRTQRILKLLVCGKPAWLQGFWWTKRTTPRRISSQPRYDHFDTAASLFDWLHSSSEKYVCAMPAPPLERLP